MKKLLLSLLACTCFTSPYGEGGAPVKPKFEPFGFVKGDMYYTIGGVSSWNTPALTSASSATGMDTNAVGFTAQHTRIGLKGSGSAGDIAMGGVVEMDFFVIAANANAKPRMRLAYAWCSPLKGLEIRAGQQWDLFSPLNPTTNNTNANLWYNGNYGFRRPQLTLQYGFDLGAVKPVIQVSGGETTREDDLKVNQAADTSKKVTLGTWLGSDNLSKIPLVQGRIAAVSWKGLEIGVATAYGAYGKARDYSTLGISADAKLPFHALFELVGEFAAGRNLNNANLFTVGGSGSATKDVTTSGFWVQAISKPCKWFNVVVGGGDEIVTSDIATGDIESNMTFYGDLIFPIGEFFSLSVEYQLFRTKIQGRPEVDIPHKTNVAHVIDIAGKVVF